MLVTSREMGQNSSARERITTGETAQLGAASDLTEIMEYFDALEADRRRLQDLLQERNEEYEMELRALERERVQERMEWEKEMVEREARLLSAVMSVVISREKLVKDLA